MSTPASARQLIRARAVRLPVLLGLLPRDGVGSIVYQPRWGLYGFPLPPPTPFPAASATIIQKRIEDRATLLEGSCRWEIKKVILQLPDFEEDMLEKNPIARVFGVKYWNGVRETPIDVEMEKIPPDQVHMDKWVAFDSPPSLLRPLSEPKKEEVLVTKE